MRILIADDDAVSRLRLKAILAKRGHDVVAAENGNEALEALRLAEAPRLAILDWIMPGLDGVDVCRQIRAQMKKEFIYLILLTSRDSKESIVEGLQAGANDYITKPFDPDELYARVQVGQEVIRLQTELGKRVSELEEALAHVKALHGLLPICSYCKKIRDDKNYWHQVESYISDHAEVMFSHGICPTCYDKVMKDFKTQSPAAAI